MQDDVWAEPPSSPGFATLDAAEHEIPPVWMSEGHNSFFREYIARGQVHLAVDDADALLGFIVFFSDGEHMQLENVAVQTTAAGQGIGKTLIQFCETEARRLGFKTVHLCTNEKMTENLSLYPHLGYSEVARRTEHGFNRVFFEKVVR